MSAAGPTGPAPVRIAIIAHGMRVAGGLSVGLNMMSSLSRVAPQHAYLAIVPAQCGYEAVCENLRNCETVLYRPRGPAGRFWFDACRLPALIRSFRPDVVFALGGKGLTRPPCPQAVFPQDPHLFYPERHFARDTTLQKWTKRYLKRHFAAQLRHSQLVLCQTEVVERRIRETFGYSGDAFVCSSAVSPHLVQQTEPRPMPAVLERLGDRFRLFYLTKYHAHKNLEALVDVYAQFRDELDDTATVVTIAPEHHRLAPRFLESVERAGLGRWIVNAGPIPHAEVGDYYQHVDAMLMPTTLETFGIPYVEAMRFGVPILTSDLDFAHAVCGEAAAYFDPWDARSIRDAIIRVRDDRGLRTRLSERGRHRLATFFRSWDDITREIVLRLERLARPGRSE